MLINKWHIVQLLRLFFRFIHGFVFQLLRFTNNKKEEFINKLTDKLYCIKNFLHLVNDILVQQGNGSCFSDDNTT